MKQLKLLFLLVFLVSTVSLSCLVGGAGLEYYGIEDSIKEDLSVNNVITLKFDTPISHLKYQLDFKIYNLTTSATFDLADCAVLEKNYKSAIICDFIGMSTNKNLLKLSFDTKEGIKKLDGGYQFSVNYGISLPVKDTFIIIKLPQRGVLLEEPANKSYLPQDGGTMTDGKHIMVYWERSNLASGNELQFSVLYAMPANIPSSLIMALTAAILIAMIGIGVYIKRFPKAKEVVASVLNDDERIIIDLLNKYGGKAMQKILVRESDFSKAKISRLVKNLQSRNIIIVEPVSGRENRIVLKQ